MTKGIELGTVASKLFGKIINKGSTSRRQSQRWIAVAVLGTIMVMATAGAAFAAAPSSTDVSSSQNPARFGDPITFTATVTPSSATGTVQFTIDGVKIGSPLPISAGSASVAMSSTPPVGTSSVVAEYSGDDSFAPSSGSLTGGQRVNKAGSTTQVSSNKNPAKPSEPVTLTASVLPSTATGMVEFKVDGVSVGGSALTDGKAKMEIGSGPAAGTRTVTADYTGNDHFKPSSGTLAGGLKVSAKAPSTTVVTANPSIIKFADSMSFTASVSPSTATGAVQFKIDGQDLVKGTLSDGKAIVAVSHSPRAGNRIVTAEYKGDANFSPSTATTTLKIERRDPFIEVTSNRNPSAPGDKILLTAKVGPQFPNDGLVRFLVDGVKVDMPRPLKDGSATLEIDSPPAGTHTISAEYSGGSDLNPGTGTMAGPQRVVVSSSKAGSSVVVTATPNPVDYGQSVVFTATVTPPTATGHVQFKIDGQNTAGGDLRDGKITIAQSHSPRAGNHTVTAEYAGDSKLKPSSAELAGGLRVNKASSTVALSSRVAISGKGRATTYTATVSPTMATGTVQFKVDGRNLGGPVRLVEGVAHSEATRDDNLWKTLSAEYSGDSNFNPSENSVRGITGTFPPPPAGKSGGVLPRTGSSSLGLGLAAVALMGTGLALVRRSRRPETQVN